MSNRPLLPSLASLFLATGFSWAQPAAAPATTSAPVPAETVAPAVPFLSQSTPLSRFWVRGEYLLWWTKNAPIPSSTVVDATNTKLEDVVSGAIFKYPSLVGTEPGSIRQGGRFSTGIWLDPGQTFGVEGSYFFLGDQNGVQHTSSLPGSSLGSPTSISFSVPGTTIPGSGIYILGGIDTPAAARVEIRSALQGAEFNGVFNVFQGANFRLGILGGYRWFDLKESLTYEATSTRVAFVGSGTNGLNTFAVIATKTDPNLMSLSDRFATSNNFNGGQIGARADFTAGRFFGNVAGKVALGSMRETIEVSGVNNVFPLFVPTLANGGIYAQQSNIGIHQRDVPTVASELTTNLGWQPVSWMKASVGYTFFYVNRVVRPGDQMRNTLDVTPIFTGNPGTVPSSANLFNESSFWAQGLNFSLEFQY